jgi:hypothetical protein
LPFWKAERRSAIAADADVNCPDGRLTSDDSVELELAINIGLFDLEVGRSIDLSGRGHDDKSKMGGIWVSLKKKREGSSGTSRECLAEVVCGCEE